MATAVFIDGEYGTTGLQIKSRLLSRSDIKLASLSENKRKCKRARSEILNDVDIVILCLPDDGARDAVAMIQSPSVRIIDASSAHRICDEWIYGFPEYNLKQSEKIANARRVTNPGCYAVAAVSMLYPLIISHILPHNFPATIHAVSGYSGGGKKLITEFEDKSSPNYTNDTFRIYSLDLEHKHISEIQAFSGLSMPPIFVPSVGRFRQGMIVQVPLFLEAIAGKPSIDLIVGKLEEHYKNRRFISVNASSENKNISAMNPEICNGTNEIKIFVAANKDKNQVVLFGILDNLGKGASGQALQNLNLMLGLDESYSLNHTKIHSY
jgi:N-acetyl-gamma-glutamyl-phosphate reductase